MSTPQRPPAGSGIAARGAVDLAALAQAKEQQRQAQERATNPDTAPASDLIVDITAVDLQAQLVDRSFLAPVVLYVWAGRYEESKQLLPALEKFVTQDAGKWVLAKVDIDVEPQIAQALQVQAVPTVIAFIKGQPVPMFNSVIPTEQLRQILDELIKVAAENGVVGQPQAGGEETPERVEDPNDELFEAAADAFEVGDWEAAKKAYELVLATTPEDQDAKAGIERLGLMQRIEGLDKGTVTAAASDPTNVEAVCQAADFEMAAANEAAAFTLLIASVRATTGDERARVKDHLLTLFKLLPADDPAVAKARADLANALF